MIKTTLDKEIEITDTSFNCKNCLIKSFQKETALTYSIYVRNIQEGEVEIVPDENIFAETAFKYYYDKNAPQAILNYGSKGEIKFQVSEKLFRAAGDNLTEVTESDNLSKFFSTNGPILEGVRYTDDGIGNRLLILTLKNLKRGDYLSANPSAPLLDASGNKLVIEKLIYDGASSWEYVINIKKPTIKVNYLEESNKGAQTIKIETEIGNEVFLYCNENLILSYEQSSVEHNFEVSQQKGQNNFRLVVRNPFLISSEYSFKTFVDSDEPKTSYELSDREIMLGSELKLWGEADKDVENVELEVYDNSSNLVKTLGFQSTDGKWNFSLTNLDPGFYNMKLKVVDRLGNISNIDLGGIRIKLIKNAIKSKPIKLAMSNNEVKTDTLPAISQPKEEVTQESEIASAKGLLASGTQDSKSSSILVNSLIALLIIVFLSALGASVYFGYGYVLISSRSVLEKVKARKEKVVVESKKENKTDQNQPDKKEPPSIRW